MKRQKLLLHKTKGGGLRSVFKNRHGRILYVELQCRGDRCEITECYYLDRGFGRDNIPKKFITRKCRLDNINDIIERELDRKFYGIEISDSFSELTAEEFIAAKLKDMKNGYKFLIFVGSGAVVNGMPDEITTRLKNRIHRSIYLKLCRYKGELGIVSDCFYCDRNYKSREKVMPAALTSILVEYNRDAVINMVNYELNCDFTDIIFVTDNSIDIENNTAALCGNI